MTGQVLLFLFHVSNGNLVLSIGRPRLSGKEGKWPGPKFDPKNSSKLKIKFQIVIGRRRGSLLPNNKSIMNINVKQITCKWYTSTYHRNSVISIQYKPKMIRFN